MPVSSIFYFQQADTAQQIPFSIEEEKEPAPAIITDTSEKVKEKKIENKQKDQTRISAPAQLKPRQEYIPPLPESIQLPVQALPKPITVKPAPVVKKQKEYADNSQSLFTGHLLRPASYNPRIHIQTHDYWLTGTIFFSFFLFVIIRAFYGKGLGRLTAAFTGTRTIAQLYRGEYPLNSRTSLFLSLLYISVMSVFIYQAISYKGLESKFDFPGLILFLFICLSLILAYFVKIISIHLSGYLFRFEGITKEYTFGIFIFNKILGLMLLPVIILLAFVTVIPLQYLFTCGLVLISLTLISRLLWIIYNGMNTAGISKYYLFLYLCALEILPLLVLIKFISRKFL
jgi:hypothetical protein